MTTIPLTQTEEIVWNKYPESVISVDDGERFFVSLMGEENKIIIKRVYKYTGAIMDDENRECGDVRQWWTILAWAELPKGWAE